MNLFSLSSTLTDVPTLHLTCGLPGAGKTTLARRLEEQHGALRLTTDEWLLRLFTDEMTMAENERYRDRMEGQLLDLAMRVLSLGVDVVLDFGVWSRKEREEFRGRAAAVGARTELHFLDVPHDELVARLEQRNREQPAAVFRISAEQLRFWATLFEPPSADELLPRDPPAAMRLILPFVVSPRMMPSIRHRAGRGAVGEALRPRRRERGHLLRGHEARLGDADAVAGVRLGQR